MDRTIVYPSALPQDTDILQPQVNGMVANGWLTQAVFGTSTMVSGLACTPTSPASMVVNVGAGCIVSLQEIDASAYGSIAANTASLMKTGINTGSTSFTLTAPTTSGYSINYLIEAAFSESDGSAVVLPYYNPSSPSTPYAGPSNNGSAQNTVRSQTVALQLKAGAAATAGTQTTPAVDSGYVGLYVITVNYGATTVTASNISTYSGAPFVNSATGIASGRLIGVQIFTSSAPYTPSVGANSIIVEAVGGGGSGGGAGYITTAGYCTIGGAGGAGGYVKHRITSLDSSYAVTIGAGGAAVSGDLNGAVGGATLFGSIILAHGGWGGATSGNGNSGSVPFFVTQPANIDNTGGNIVSKKGEKGQYGLRVSSSTSGFVAVSGTGGQGPFGNGGAGRSTVIASDNGNGYGSGGGGALNWSATTTLTNVASGAGAPGIVIVWEYA